MQILFSDNYLELLFVNELTNLFCFDNEYHIVTLNSTVLEVNGFRLSFEHNYLTIRFHDHFQYNPDAVLRIIFAKSTMDVAETERIVFGYIVVNMRGHILSWCSNFRFVDGRVPSSYRQHTGVVLFLDHRRLTLVFARLYRNRRIINFQRFIFGRENMFSSSGFVHSFTQGIFRRHIQSSMHVLSIVRQFFNLLPLIRGIPQIHGEFFPISS